MLTSQEFLKWVGPGTVVIDGGLSTQLEHQGCVLSSSLWTGQALLDDPSQIEQAHIAFVEAGARVLITSSYQLSRQGFIQAGLSSEQADEALAESVEVAKRARGDRDVLIVASVGPYGAILHDGSEYRGNYGLSLEELRDFHTQRLEVLIQAEPDVLAIETIPDALEIRALVDTLATFPEAIGWLSVSVGADGQLWSGDVLEEALSPAFESSQICALGVNCVDPDVVEGVLARLRKFTDLPLVVYANGGGSWNAEKGVWEGAGSQPLTSYLQTWKKFQPLLVGGCCGTAAEDIQQLSLSMG